jgi:uncharacterized spore protein YtfJ
VDGGFIERIADHLGQNARATTIFADPIERDGVTIVPVARARWGFGGGAGRQKEGEEGTGGGGGMVVTPVGYIEMRKGHSTFRPIVNRQLLLPLLLVAGVLAFRAARKMRFGQLTVED